MIPDRKLIKDLFEGLLGREVTIDDGVPVDLGIPKPIVASYVDDQHGLRAVALMDLPLAAYAGAAIALVAKAAADSAVTEQRLPPNLFENAVEICNVFAAPLGEASMIHQRLQETWAPSDSIPAHIMAVASTLGAREDVTIDISGYGAGTFSIVAVI